MENSFAMKILGVMGLAERTDIAEVSIELRDDQSARVTIGFEVLPGHPWAELPGRRWKNIEGLDSGHGATGYAWAAEDEAAAAYAVGLEDGRSESGPAE